MDPGTSPSHCQISLHLLTIPFGQPTLAANLFTRSRRSSVTLHRASACQQLQRPVPAPALPVSQPQSPPRVSKVSGNCPHPAPPAADPGRMEAGPRTSPPPGGGQVVLSGKLADQSRLLLRRGSQRSVGQLLLVMDVVQHEDRLSRKTRSLTLEPASLQGSLSTANRNHVQPDSQIARKGTFKAWLLFYIMTRPLHIESKLIGYLAEVLGLLVPSIKVVQGKSSNRFIALVEDLWGYTELSCR